MRRTDRACPLSPGRSPAAVAATVRQVYQHPWPRAARVIHPNTIVIRSRRRLPATRMSRTSGRPSQLVLSARHSDSDISTQQQNSPHLGVFRVPSRQ
jgi:hypothetical protein